MVQIKLSIAFVLAAAAIAPVIAQPISKEHRATHHAHQDLLAASEPPPRVHHHHHHHRKPRVMSGKSDGGNGEDGKRKSAHLQVANAEGDKGNGEPPSLTAPTPTRREYIHSEDVLERSFGDLEFDPRDFEEFYLD